MSYLKFVSWDVIFQYDPEELILVPNVIVNSYLRYYSVLLSVPYRGQLDNWGVLSGSWAPAYTNRLEQRLTNLDIET